MPKKINALGAVLSYLLFLPLTAHASSTGVGSGGDVVDLYLEATRRTLIMALGNLRERPKDVETLCTCAEKDATHPLCSRLLGLNPAQKLLCQEFLGATRDEMLHLNQNSKPVPFALSMTPLTVPGPDGQARPVIAMTPLGAGGSITFHYDSVRTLSPIMLLALLTHEFGHKTTFNAAYVDDNPPLGAFDQPGGGRALLDAAGAGLAWYAAKAGIVGQEFGVVDTFSCDITETTSGMGLPAIGPSPRLFLARESLDAYETGIGTWPGQMPCNWRNDQHSILSFQMLIHEEDSCAEGEAAAGRRATTLAVYLYHLSDKAGDPTPPPEVLQAKVLTGFNPLCTTDAAQPLTIELPYGQHKYKVVMRYRSSTARTD